MKAHHKRCKTPLKQQQGNQHHKKQATSPSKSASTFTKHQKQIKQSIENMPLNNLALASPNIDISREKCQSPAMTSVGGFTNVMTQRHPFGDGDHNLKIALELAQFHKKQMEVSRAKAAEMEDRIRRLENQLKDMGAKNQELEDRAEKYQDKYRKLKQKYRQLKSMQEDKSSSEIKIVQTAVEQSLKKKQSQKAAQKRTEIVAEKVAEIEGLYKIIRELQSEVNTKNKNIHTLCQQVSECEQNCQNILQLVSILEQRVQELTMDNNLMKGVLRERQKSQSEDLSRGYNSNVSGIFGGAGRNDTNSSQDIKMVDMRRRRDIMDYGIIHYQDRNYV